MRERALLMLLIQATGAAAEPTIGDALRECFAKQVEYARAVARASDEQIRDLPGQGLLANVMVAIQADEVDALWVRTLTGTGPVD